MPGKQPDNDKIPQFVLDQVEALARKIVAGENLTQNDRKFRDGSAKGLVQQAVTRLRINQGLNNNKKPKKDNEK